MKEMKPIYYSEKGKKYYFNNITAFGNYFAEKVYGGENLKGGEVKTDKNGRQYIMGYVERAYNKNTGFSYWKCTGFVPPKESNEQSNF